jgi:ornithine carbamoyltransferase
MNARHFLSINDVSKEELLHLLDLSAQLKADLYAGKDQSHLLKNKSLGMIFEKPSLRTRISFEVGIKQLGGNAVVLNSNEIQMGVPLLKRYYD